MRMWRATATTTSDTEKEREVYETPPEGSNASLPSANESDESESGAGATVPELERRQNQAADAQDVQELTIEELLARGGGGGSRTHTPMITGVEAWEVELGETETDFWILYLRYHHFLRRFRFCCV